LVGEKLNGTDEYPRTVESVIGRTETDLRFRRRAITRVGRRGYAGIKASVAGGSVILLSFWKTTELVEKLGGITGSYNLSSSPS